MKVKIYQIAPDKDRFNLMFMNYDFTMKKEGVCEEAYEIVFDGELDVKSLDDIYTIFNTKLLEKFYGRCMSVSDVVCADGLGTFFVDSIGFKQIKFDAAQVWNTRIDHPTEKGGVQ